MNKFNPRLLAALFGLALLSASVQAANVATVETVRAPAWIEKAGKREPLVPGTTIGEKDKVYTGGDGRLVLRLPEGSPVVLGENVQFAIPSMKLQGQGKSGVFESTLQLFTGTLRYVTSALNSFKDNKRSVQVRTATATIGIRGTDFWTMTDADHDAVCVFEGKVDVTRPNEPLAILDGPGAFWVANTGKPPNPLGVATSAQLAKFKESVAVVPGSGLALKGGAWKVIAALADDKQTADGVQAMLRERGYAASSKAVRVGGQNLIEVRITDLATEEDAQALARKIKPLAGVSPLVVLPEKH